MITAGSGLPETPIYLAAVNGHGRHGDAFGRTATGGSIYAGRGGHFLNAAAFTAPAPGQWGNAGRDSITGAGTVHAQRLAGADVPVGEAVQPGYSGGLDESAESCGVLELEHDAESRYQSGIELGLHD